MEPSVLSKLTLTVLTGAVAGFANVTAGGGSLLTLPVLNIIGLDLGVANATNRVSILFQNLSAVRYYHSAGKISLKEAFPYVLPATAGAVAGTITAIRMSSEIFTFLAALSILLMGMLLITKPERWERRTGTPLPLPIRIGLLFLAGTYGGFIQAGVGFLLIWALSVGCGKDIREANILKSVIVVCYTAASLIIFASFGMVDWSSALMLTTGAILGGNAGARFNLSAKNRTIRLILACAVFVSSIKMLWESLR